MPAAPLWIRRKFVLVILVALEPRLPSPAPPPPAGWPGVRFGPLARLAAGHLQTLTINRRARRPFNWLDGDLSFEFGDAANVSLRSSNGETTVEAASSAYNDDSGGLPARNPIL